MEQRGDKIPKSTLQEGNRVSKRRKSQPDSKSGESEPQNPKWGERRKD